MHFVKGTQDAVAWLLSESGLARANCALHGSHPASLLRLTRACRGLPGGIGPLSRMLSCRKIALKILSKLACRIMCIVDRGLMAIIAKFLVLDADVMDLLSAQIFGAGFDMWNQMIATLVQSALAETELTN